MNVKELVECCYCEDSTKHPLEECIERKLATARSLEFLAEIKADVQSEQYPFCWEVALRVWRKILDFSPEEPREGKEE